MTASSQLTAAYRRLTPAEVQVAVRSGDSMNRVVYGWYDGYEPFQVAAMLLDMSVVAESQAQVRRGAANTSRRLGRLYGRPEDFEAAARALESASVRIAVGGRRMRRLAERLTGVCAWDDHA